MTDSRERSRGAAFVEAAVALAVGIPLLVTVAAYSYGIYGRGIIRDILDSGLHDFMFAPFRVEHDAGTFTLVPRNSELIRNSRKLLTSLSEQISQKTGLTFDDIYLQSCVVVVSVDPVSGNSNAISQSFCEEAGSKAFSPSETVQSIISNSSLRPGIPHPVTGYYHQGVVFVIRTGARIFPDWVSHDLPVPSFIPESRLYIPSTEISL